MCNNNDKPMFFALPEFYSSEVAQQYNILNYPNPGQADDVNRALLRLACKVMDVIRAYVGTPIYITSGYRCKRLNMLVGGSATSQHMTGQACDFTIPTYSHIQLKKLYYDLATWLEYDQLIYYPRKNIIHVSYISIKDNRHKTWISGDK